MAVSKHTNVTEANNGMQIKTILNRIQRHRGFVYGDVRLEEHVDGLALTIDVVPHRRNRPTCSGCRLRNVLNLSGRSSAMVFIPMAARFSSITFQQT